MKLKEKFFNCAKSSPRGLAPVLKKWIVVNETYNKSEKWRDAIWWCNERANIGAFAAAVWLSGGVALEEYITRKKHKGSERAGRCDLSFRFTKNGDKFACEAKYLLLPLGGTLENKIKRQIEGNIAKAVKDARKLDKSEGRKLAFCFIVPRFSPTKKRPAIKRALIKLTSMLQEMRLDAIAWFFPKRTKDLRWTTNVCCPGVMLVVKTVHA
jgi:hypothetical protein